MLTSDPADLAVLAAHAPGGEVKAAAQVDERADEGGTLHLAAGMLFFGERPIPFGVLLAEVDAFVEPVPLVAARPHGLAGDEHAIGGSLVAAVEAYDDAVVKESEGGGHGPTGPTRT